MDPLSILSILASTVQFMDFGTRVLKAILDLRRGGSSATRADVDELNGESWELIEHAQDIGIKASRLEHLGRPLTVTEAAILRESRRCVEAGQEIGRSLEEHAQDRPNRSMVNIVGAAFKLVWNGSTIRNSKARLADAREKLMLAMVSNLW